jgi:hypothetical protein
VQPSKEQLLFQRSVNIRHREKSRNETDLRLLVKEFNGLQAQKIALEMS